MNFKELEQQIEQLASAIDWIKTKLVDLQEEKGLAPVKTPFEVELPENGKEFWFIDYGENRTHRVIFDGNDARDKNSYLNGDYFETKEEAEQHLKEQRLIFKIKKWAKIHNDGWVPDWSDINENKYYIYYDHSMGSERLRIDLCWISEKFSKLPYFKTIEIARECVDLFGNEIIKVLC